MVSLWARMMMMRLRVVVVRVVAAMRRWARGVEVVLRSSLVVALRLTVELLLLLRQKRWWLYPMHD